MELTKKIFWREAARGGTIIGLALAAFSLLHYNTQTSGLSVLSSILSVLNLVVFVMLIYGFTRRTAAMADPREGFPYGRAMGFVLAMMLFTGLIQGVYEAVMNNFVYPDEVWLQYAAAIDAMKGMISSSDMDMVQSMGKVLFNPLYLVLVSIIVRVLYGGFVGLIVSALVKRDPDIFAARKEEDRKEEEE